MERNALWVNVLREKNTLRVRVTSSGLLLVLLHLALKWGFYMVANF